MELHPKQKRLIWLRKFTQDYLPFLSIAFLAIVLALNLGTPLLQSETKEIPDILMEGYIVFLLLVSLYIKLSYVNTFKYFEQFLDKKNTSMFKETVLTLSSHNYSVIKTERKDYWSLNILFLYLIPIVYIVLGQYNQILGDMQPHDFGYGIGLLVLTLIINLIMIENGKDGIKQIVSEKVLKENKEDKTSIEISIIEIKEHLKIFNKTSQFRLRVENAVNLIIDIYVINKDSLERLQDDKELRKKIEKKNKIIETELRKMLFSIIDYNNERNDEILASIDKNIALINSLRG